MSTHTRVPVCAGKAGFDTPDLAAKVARRMRQNHQARVREYRCHDCGCWHIGNPKPRGKDAPKSKRDRRMSAPADTPEICAARAADPAWRAEQVEKNRAASERFRDYRESVGLPIGQSLTTRVAGADR